MNTQLDNLKAAWIEYKNKTGETQVVTSKKLGWASATLGLYLNGRRQLTAEHAAQVANLFHIDVTKIVHGTVAQVREIDIVATSSGNKPPQATKKIRYESGRMAIFCDIPVLIEGATLAVPAGTTLLVAEPDAQRPDDRWPHMASRYWVVQAPNKVKIFLSETKPKVRSGEKLFLLTSVLTI